MKICGDETGPDTLDRVGRGGSTTDHRGGRRFNGEHFELRKSLLEKLRARGDVSTSSNAGDQVIDPSRKVREDLFRCRLPMNLDVRFVLKLLGHPCAGRCGEELVGFLNSALHPLLSGSKDELRTVGEHDAPSFDGHGLRHNEDEAIPLNGGYHREPHTCIS